VSKDTCFYTPKYDDKGETMVNSKKPNTIIVVMMIVSIIVFAISFSY
jgi:hypothetical protein